MTAPRYAATSYPTAEKNLGLPSEHTNPRDSEASVGASSVATQFARAYIRLARSRQSDPQTQNEDRPETAEPSPNSAFETPLAVSEPLSDESPTG